jgi:hypothetical protein
MAKGDIRTAWEQYLSAKFQGSVLALKKLHFTADFLGIDTSGGYGLNTVTGEEKRADIEFLIRGVKSCHEVWTFGEDAYITSLLPPTQRFITHPLLVPLHHFGERWRTYNYETVDGIKQPILYFCLSLERVVSLNLYPSDELLSRPY